MNDFSFFVLTDTHYYKSSLGAYGKAYDEFMRYEQKCFAETESINRALFSEIADSSQADTVIFCGDMTFNGEKECHIEFASLLSELESVGKKVFVTIADHDFHKDCFGFDDEGRVDLEPIDDEELFSLYAPFSTDKAIAVNENKRSYVAQLSDGVRLLSFNGNKSRRSDYFDDEHLEWIREQSEHARADGQILFAVNHYPILPGQPIFSVVSSATQYKGASLAEFFAEQGIHLIFTGHMHNQSVNEIITGRGDRFFDVSTASVIAQPSVYRLVTIRGDDTVDIRTKRCPDFVFNGEELGEEYLTAMFDSMILNLIGSMKDEPDRLLHKFGKDGSDLVKKIVGFFGKKLDTATVGDVCRLLRVKCPESLRSLPIKTYACDLVREVFEGNQSYKRGTDRGDVFLAALARLSPVLDRINVKDVNGNKVDLAQMLETSAGNYGRDDWNCTIRLRDRNSL